MVHSPPGTPTAPAPVPLYRRVLLVPTRYLVFRGKRWVICFVILVEKGE